MQDVEITSQSPPYKVIMKVAKSHIKTLISELFRAFEVEDIVIEEEDITDVVEKIYKYTHREGQV